MTGRARANGEGSIFPYRNGFAAYSWVTKPDGKRARKYVYGKTREEVHDKWIKLQSDARKGPVATKVPTVSSFLDYWLRELVKPNLAPATYVYYEMFTRLYIVPGLGSRRLDRLQVREVQTWINAVARSCLCCTHGKDAARPENRRRCCARGQCCNKQPSASTMKGLRATLRAALAQAATEELVSKNLATLLKLPKGRKRAGKRWESEEARRFLEAVRRGNDPLYAAYVLILVLGLRKGEVLGLGWDDLDLNAGTLTINWQLQRIGGELVRRKTKTEESDATLPLPALCIAALRLRHAQQKEARAAAGDEWWDDDGLVFTTRHGTPIEPRNFNRAFDSWVRRAAVPRITVHDARRTCGSPLVDLDVHPRVVMQILRHAQFSITMEIYAKVSSKATRDALKRLGESLDGS
jgi:integrase